jgi:hypothetical protein
VCVRAHGVGSQVLAASGYRTLESLSVENCSRSDLQGVGMKIAETKQLLNAVKEAQAAA